jgi:transcriptional regulator with XRE-family HTH domain
MDRMLSAQQIRAGRSLLGWSRRELAIVSGISQGTIKAIEQGMTDARLSTLRKLAQTFTAHGVEFVTEGARSGVTIKNGAKDPSAQFGRSHFGTIPTTPMLGDAGDATPTSNAAMGRSWLRPLRAARSRKT